MSKSPGRPSRPSRTDPEEIKRSAARWDEKVRAGLAARFPFEPRGALATDEWINDFFRSPIPPPNAMVPPAMAAPGTDAAEATAGSRDEIRREHIGTVPTSFDGSTPPQDIFIVYGRPAAPRAYSPPTESDLKFDREVVDQLREAGAPMAPPWVLDAAGDAYAAQLDGFASPQGGPTNEAVAHALRPLKEAVRARIKDPGGIGVKVRLRLFLDIEGRFKAFMATLPTPADYRDTLIGLYVPLFNATNGRCRRCLDCGTMFALRTPAEIKKSRYCCDKCARRASKRGRERTGNGRSAIENTVRKFGERCRRHLERCPVCQSGAFCSTGESYIAMSNTDALDRLRGDPPE